MLTPLVAPKIVPLRGFRNDLAAALRRAVADGAWGVLTRRGRPVVGIVPAGVLDVFERSVGSPAVGAAVPVRHLRRALPAVLRRVEADGSCVAVTRRGVALVALVPLGVFARIDAADGHLAERAEAAARDLSAFAAGGTRPSPLRPPAPVACPRRVSRAPSAPGGAQGDLHG